MNDRVSAAPPPGFLGAAEPGITSPADESESSWNRTAAATGRDADAAWEPGRYHLRRPRSTAAAGWARSQHSQQSGGGGGGGGVTAKKSTGFLAPLWDGVREKLLLRGSKSSGSIGRVVNSVVGGGERKGESLAAPGAAAVTKEREQRERAAAPAVSTAGYPSREEVLESYKNLVASGFFEAHAIRGGRHPLRTGGSAPAQGHVVVPSPNARSFADHMAAQQQQKQQQLAAAFASPPRGSMGPPPPPPPLRGSSQGKPTTMPSPHRGTKRGASVDLAGEAEMVTRKLVKKLRHSASRISVDFTGVRDHHHHHYSYGTLRSRPSTSWHPAGPLSPTSSIFSGISSPPPAPAAASAADETASIRLGKLTKTKDGRRRRILSLTRRHRATTPTATTATTAAEATDPDAMMIDEPEPRSPTTTSATATEQQQTPRPRRVLTPPPASFRSARSRTSSATTTTPGRPSAQQQHHEPLSVVPDPNHGIPFVPRIPREFCDAMAAMVPPAPVAPAATAATVVVGGSGGDGKVDEARAKNANRDSGLGEDAENIPVWG
ncbi:88b32fa6-2869-4329-a9d0-9bb3e732b72f [Thermothielavioides terrestris]|nr:88b32fa6-2869-4329-a9d0-9bb3e732b72f [Thermothielavioides terrestris]